MPAKKKKKITDAVQTKSYSFNARGITSWNLADTNHGVFLTLDVPHSNSPVVREKNNGHGRRCIVVLAFHDDKKGLLSILVKGTENSF